MNKLIINGSKKLNGEISAHGSKNGALPILAATVLTDGECIIHNCPQLTDVTAATEILTSLGCKIKRESSSLSVDAGDAYGNEIPVCLMHRMRSSVIFMGAMLGKTGRAVLSKPGGCEIGLRPIDMHINAVRNLGVSVHCDKNRYVFEAPDGLHGGDITLPFPSVGATENVMLTSCTASGTTVLRNAAREPEIADLAKFLCSCGAKIHGAGESTLIIDGVKKLNPAEHTVLPDRIEAASYLLAGAVTQGRITVNDIIPADIAALIPVFQEMGCEIRLGRQSITLKAPPRLKSVRTLGTMPYPGFPTDIQAPVTAALSIADGTSVMTENIFESRYRHIPELEKMGARISTCGRRAVIEGVPYLTGTKVSAPDLRGGFALIIAGLAARGKTEITAVCHIDRGYEKPELLLGSLGADIKRI